MSLVLSRLSDCANAKEKEKFSKTFSECVSGIRSKEYDGFAPSSAYTQALLQIASKRPGDFFMIQADEKIVGRAGVTRYLSNKEIACLGFFETTTADVARSLVDAAEDWARKFGCKMLYGPVDINTWFSYRFLVSATDAHRYSWEPVQPPEYPVIFEGLGFEPVETYFTRGVDFAVDEPIVNLLALTGAAYEGAKAKGYVFEQFQDAEGLLSLLGDLYEVCMSAFPGAFLFEPLTPSVFQMLYMSVANQRDFSSSHLVRNSQGTVVGFLFSFLDKDQIVIKTIAVSPELRGLHLSTALIHLTLKVAHGRGIKKYISALVREGNSSEHLFNSRTTADHKTWDHQYVLFGKKL